MTHLVGEKSFPVVRDKSCRSGTVEPFRQRARVEQVATCRAGERGLLPKSIRLRIMNEYR